MALRLKPFRQYSEHDVINMYSLDISGDLNAGSSGLNDNGVFVTVTAGDLDNDPVEYGSNSYLGADFSSDGVHSQYPTVPLKVTALAGDGSAGTPLGITLRQTLTHDENGEKLLYYPVKRDELQAVLPGQAVPVATKGVFTFGADGIDQGDVPAPGEAVYLVDGKVSGTAGAGPQVGTCLAAGDGSEDGSEQAVIVKIDL